MLVGPCLSRDDVARWQESLEQHFSFSTPNIRLYGA